MDLERRRIIGVGRRRIGVDLVALERAPPRALLVARAEASSEKGLERLMAQIDAQLAASGLERGEQAGH
jgi:hypothetical protein